MLNDDELIKSRLGKEYLNHVVFYEIDEYIEFYESLSFSTMNWISMGTTSAINLDTYVFSSLNGTLESIKVILKMGRINDAFALLRKYYDATLINIYSNLFLEDNLNLENRIVKQIEEWKNGIETIPNYRIISNYIKNSPKLKPVTALLQKDNRYKKIRDRCNDHVHYNFYQNLLYNDNAIYVKNRVVQLEYLSNDLKNLFIQHISYLFYLKDNYMMSSDYIDSLEIGLEPEEGSQYFVAPFVQNMFNDVMKKSRPDIVALIKQNTSMELR